MSVIHSFNEQGELLPEEVDTINHLTKLPIGALNLEAIAAVTNLYRSAQGLRNKMEQEVLSEHGLSWTAFSMLYDLWIWEAIETRKIAESLGVSKATVSSITKTLERKELCYRKSDAKDKRLTYVVLAERGKQVMEALYPKFHQNEIEIVSSLTPNEQHFLADVLRKVIKSNHF
ncbi:MarR family transcriptional regulator [Paenibacillus polymyxa]|nr:MarR family transcriptional regulator [Paenibacillus polymyxa]